MNALVAIPNTTHSSGCGIPTDHEIAVYNTIAKSAVDSKMYGRLDQAAVMTIMLSARELGIPPMQALNGGLNIIQGKVEISASMMSALIRRAGHSIITVESTDEVCTLRGQRADNGDIATVSYTLAEAQRAGLVKPGGGWAKNPADMCYARAISRLKRQLFADIGVGYVEGEIKPEVEIVELPKQIGTDAQIIEAFLKIFPAENAHLAREYFDEVKDHFGWSVAQTAKNLGGDVDKLLEKFIVWKGARRDG
jgi:hypothetical protein